MKDVSEKRKSHRSVLSLDDLWLPMLLPTGSEEYLSPVGILLDVRFSDIVELCVINLNVCKITKSFFYLH